MALDLSKVANGHTEDSSEGMNTLTPGCTYEDGYLVLRIPVNQAIELAKPSKTGKTEGVMLDMRSEFVHTCKVGDKELPVRFRTSSGRTGAAYFAINAVGIAK